MRSKYLFSFKSICKAVFYVLAVNKKEVLKNAKRYFQFNTLEIYHKQVADLCLLYDYRRKHYIIS